MIEVVVIGTEPACPRCDRLSVLVEEVAAHSEVDFRISHWVYTSEAATAYAAAHGRSVGTAKDVARHLGREIDAEAVRRVILDAAERSEGGFRQSDIWTPELDDLLMPFAEAADAAGYYMTPVLIVNGVVRHHGSVPAIDDVREWLHHG